MYVEQTARGIPTIAITITAEETVQHLFLTRRADAENDSAAVAVATC
jgi:hypothetical protein